MTSQKDIERVLQRAYAPTQPPHFKAESLLFPGGPGAQPQGALALEARSTVLSAGINGPCLGAAACAHSALILPRGK